MQSMVTTHEQLTEYKETSTEILLLIQLMYRYIQ